MSETKKLILYVEDDKDSRDVMGLLLSQVGYEVVTAGSVSDAFEMAGTHRFDLYILDNWFEEGSGLELCR